MEQGTARAKEDALAAEVEVMNIPPPLLLLPSALLPRQVTPLKRAAPLLSVYMAAPKT